MSIDVKKESLKDEGESLLYQLRDYIRDKTEDKKTKTFRYSSFWVF